ncbi:hypothetical protein TNCV_3131281 [Trichonephila clavipes]|nr:hypothetical protein TNCV_3131281 [Trichonephila clavipes]
MPSLLGDSLEVSLLTDHLIGTSAHAPECPTVMYTGMGTVHEQMSQSDGQSEVRRPTSPQASWALTFRSTALGMKG